MVIVPARKIDPRAFGVQKYSNRAAWNVPGGFAPNGVSATRYLRETKPELSALTPLARWLYEHAPRCVAGKMPSFNRDERVLCSNKDGVTIDWLFDIIEPNETDEAYWNNEAKRMLAAGVTRIAIGDAEWTLHSAPEQ